MDFNQTPMLMRKRAWCLQDWPGTELPGPKSYYLVESNAPAEWPAQNWHLVGTGLTVFGMWPSLPGNNRVLKWSFPTAQAESELVCFVSASWRLKKVWMECFQIGHTQLGLPQALLFLLCNTGWPHLRTYGTHWLPQASNFWSRSNGAPCSIFS